MKSPASGSSDLIYNYWKSSETTIKNYNNILKKEKQRDYSKILILKISTDCYIFRALLHA